MRLSTTVALAGLIAVGIATTALGHDPEAQARYELSQKLESPWVTQNGFVADFPTALATATRTGKPIFAYFTISYMDLPRCESVEKGVLSTPEFKEFGKNVVLFVHVDSGLGGPYEGLLREKGGSDVPYFLVLDDQGNVIAKVPGEPNVKSFHEAVKAGAAFSALRKKADKTADETVYVLAHEMDLGGLKLQLAKDRIARLGDLSDENRVRIDAALVRLEVWSHATNARGTRKGGVAAGKLFAEMWEGGRVPTTDEHVLPFFTLMLDHAEASKDVKLFEKALQELEKQLADKPDAKGFLERQAERLEQLRKKLEPAGEAPGDAE